MKDRIKNTEKEFKETANPATIKRGLLDIGKKLGIAIPTGLLLLLNVNVDDTTKNHFLKDNINMAKELNKLQTNETVKHLLSMDKIKDNIILAQVHSNTHIDKCSPNVWNDGKHLNVHTNTHSDYTRY